MLAMIDFENCASKRLKKTLDFIWSIHHFIVYSCFCMHAYMKLSIITHICPNKFTAKKGGTEYIYIYIHGFKNKFFKAQKDA